MTALLYAAGVLLASRAAAESLDQTIAAALDHSPEIGAAQARENAAAAGVAEARAEGNPRAAAQGQIGIGRIDPRGFFGLAADDVTPRVAQVEAEWPLFTGGRVSSAIDQAEGGHEVAVLGTRVAALDLRLRVIRAYTQALAAQQQVKSFGASTKAIAEVLRQSRLTFKAGAGTSTDVAQAEARLAEAEAGLASATGALAEAEAQLAQLAGRPIAPEADLPTPPPIPPSADAVVAAALADNPQVAQARKAAEIADAGVRGAEAERLPTVAAYAEASTVRDQFFPGYKADSASVGIRAQWKFFTGGRAGAKVSKAEAEASAARFDALAAEQAVQVQAVRAFEAARAAGAVLVAAEKRAAAAQEALRSTRLEVEVGAKPQLALLDAEREAIEAESARIDAAGRELSATYALRAIAGMD